jgi:hypothetical protein
MKTWLKIIIGLIVVGIVAAVVVYNYVNRGQPDYAKAEPELTVKAKRLYTDFKMNPELATEKYCGTDGKVIQIEGSISKVEMNDSTIVLVYAYEEGMFGDEGIRVTMLPQFNKQAKQLSSIRKLVVKGLCTGYNDTDVIILHGSIVEESY